MKYNLFRKIGYKFAKFLLEMFNRTAVSAAAKRIYYYVCLFTQWT